MIFSTLRGPLKWGAGRISMAELMGRPSSPQRTQRTRRKTTASPSKSSVVSVSSVVKICCSCCRLLSQNLLGHAELLNQRDVRRADIGAAAAFETFAEVVTRSHDVVFALGRQHAEGG